MKKVLSVIIAAALLASMSAFAMTSASANTTWSLPLDVTDENWHAETWDPAYSWGAPLTEVSDTIVGESTADGKLELRFPTGGKADMTYPNARYENSGGLIQVTEDDYVNIKLSCGEKDQSDVTWSVRLNFLTNSVRLDNAIAEKTGAQQSTAGADSTWIYGGDYEVSLKVSDVAKTWLDEHSEDGSYDAIWGPGGNTYLTGVVFYMFSTKRNSEIPLSVEALTIGDEGDFDPTDDTMTTTVSSTPASSEAASEAGSSAASVASSKDASAVSSSKPASSKTKTDDGLSAGAIAAIIVAAVVVLGAVAAVIVVAVKKNKAKGAGEAKTDGAANDAKPEDNAPDGEDKKEDK